MSYHACTACGWLGSRRQVLKLHWPLLDWPGIGEEYICFGCASWSQAILMGLR